MLEISKISKMLNGVLYGDDKLKIKGPCGIQDGKKNYLTYLKNKSIVSTEKDIRSAVNTSNQEDSRNAGRLGTIINNINSFPVRTLARSTMSFLAPIPPMQFYQFEWGKDVNSRQARIFKDLLGLYWPIKTTPLLAIQLILVLFYCH